MIVTLSAGNPRASAAALVHELIEARDEKQLLRYQKNLSRQELLVVDELSFVPLSKTGTEMLFEVLSQRYERSSTLVLQMNAESYRLKNSKKTKESSPQ